MMTKEQFSPVSSKRRNQRKLFTTASQIVSTKPTQGRNLTGPARHVRDLAADVHASVQQWNAAHLRGLTLLRNITEEKQNESYSQSLQEQCDKLEYVCDELDGIVKHLAQVARQLKVVASLEKRADKLFTTWPTVKFGQVAELICNAYSNEAKVKRRVFEDVAHHCAESWKMLFLATWVHQPLLPESVTALLESLLIETGHR